MVAVAVAVVVVAVVVVGEVDGERVVVGGGEWVVVS